MRFIDITGERFGRLTVREAIRGGHEVRWRCSCDCGGEITTAGGKLRAGDTNSCGCLRRETAAELGHANRTHGHMSGRKPTPEYSSWLSMWNRCTNPRDGNWPNYGGRGITVCERWKSFEAFLEDMGLRPEGTTLDRERNAEGYSPGNCRWATAEQQNGNRRTSVILEHDGRRQSMAAWAREVGLSPQCVSMRLRSGWSVADALARRRSSHGVGSER